MPHVAIPAIFVNWPRIMSAVTGNYELCDLKLRPYWPVILTLLQTLCMTLIAVHFNSVLHPDTAFATIWYALICSIGVFRRCPDVAFTICTHNLTKMLWVHNDNTITWALLGGYRAIKNWFLAKLYPSGYLKKDRWYDYTFSGVILWK